jgi:hypothetical protein
LKNILWFVLFLVVNIESLSQSTSSMLGPIIPDRPGQTNPPDIVPAGLAQLETGFSRETTTSGDVHLVNYLYNTSLVRIGVLENFELRFVLEYAGTKVDSASHASVLNGFNPISIGTKLAVSPEKGIIPQTSLNVSVTLPYFGEKEFRPTFLAPSFFFLMQNTLNNKFMLGYNLGLQWDGVQPNATAVYSVSLSMTALVGLSIFAECYGFTLENSTSDYRSDFGCAYLINNNIQIDLSGGVGLNAVAPDSFVAFGLAWRWDR